MAKSRKLLTVGALGVGAMALIGSGATAVFTDSVNATQEVNTGTMTMAISSTDTNHGNVADGQVSPDGKSITFTVTNSGSQLNQKHSVTVHNTGSLPLVMSSVSVTPDGSKNDGPLNQEVLLNLDGYKAPAGISVAAAEATGWTCIGADCTIQPKSSYTFPFEFHADLSNAAQGQTIRPKLTIGATEANPSAGNRPVQAGAHFAPVAKN